MRVQPFAELRRRRFGFRSDAAPSRAMRAPLAKKRVIDDPVASSSEGSARASRKSSLHRRARRRGGPAFDVRDRASVHRPLGLRDRVWVSVFATERRLELSAFAITVVVAAGSARQYARRASRREVCDCRPGGRARRRRGSGSRCGRGARRAAGGDHDRDDRRDNDQRGGPGHTAGVRAVAARP